MDINTRVVYAELFPLDTSVNEVKGLFSLFGKINHINMPTFYPEHPLNKGHSNARTKGYAFIEYQTKDDAKRACDFFNDTNNITVSDQQMSTKNDSAPKEARSKLLDNPRYIALMPLRVMLKCNHLDLVRQYREQKLQSLMRVAKTLAIV